MTWRIRHLSVSTPEDFCLYHRISFNWYVALWKNERCASGEGPFLLKTKCFTPLCEPASSRSVRTTVGLTLWLPLWLVPSFTTPGGMSQTVTCTFSCWCLHLNPDSPRNRSGLVPSALAVRVSTVGTLFSCQELSCENPRVATLLSSPLVPSLGLSYGR